MQSFFIVVNFNEHLWKQNLSFTLTWQCSETSTNKKICRRKNYVQYLFCWISRVCKRNYANTSSLPLKKKHWPNEVLVWIPPDYYFILKKRRQPIVIKWVVVYNDDLLMLLMHIIKHHKNITGMKGAKGILQILLWSCKSLHYNKAWDLDFALFVEAEDHTNGQ